MRQLNKKNSDSNIFLDQKNSDASEDRFKEKDSQSFQGIPYLKRGDSSNYIEQFIGKEEPNSPLRSEINTIMVPPPPIVHQQPKEENDHSEQQNVQSWTHSQHLHASAFHNFQKHLTLGLKHAIIFKDENKQTKQYVKVAAKLWKAFLQSKICTKKILHFLLGDKNEHQISNQDLRQFGFYKIYENYGDKLVRQSRVFLLREVLRQIKEQNCLQVYFQHKKIKDKEKFKKYIRMFVQQLQSGFLKKRLPREKVAELMR